MRSGNSGRRSVRQNFSRSGSSGPYSSPLASHPTTLHPTQTARITLVPTQTSMAGTHPARHCQMGCTPLSGQGAGMVGGQMKPGLARSSTVPITRIPNSPTNSLKRQFDSRARSRTTPVPHTSPSSPLSRAGRRGREGSRRRREDMDSRTPGNPSRTHLINKPSRTRARTKLPLASTCLCIIRGAARCRLDRHEAQCCRVRLGQTMPPTDRRHGLVEP
jgi:hypothetical protein